MKLMFVEQRCGKSVIVDNCAMDRRFRAHFLPLQAKRQSHRLLERCLVLEISPRGLFMHSKKGGIALPVPVAAIWA